MSFKLTIEIPDTKLAATLRQLAGHKVVVETTTPYIPGWDDPRKGKPNGASTHGRGASLLTMTGKIAQPSSQIAVAMTIFEKLEKKKGIGSVTVADFREGLIKKDLPKAMAQRCVTEKFMSYI